MGGEKDLLPGKIRLGAYGLALNGLPGAAAFMQAQGPGAPDLQIQVEIMESGRPHSEPIDGWANLGLIGGGRLQICRGGHEARYLLPEKPPDEELLHPYVAPAAALFWQWSGREALHAGAYAAGSGAVLILGDKEAGKSTTLGWLATEAGSTVLTDDLAVMDGDMVLAGPRSIDLRVRPGDPEAPANLVRNGERDRLRLPASPNQLPLAGMVVLDWAPEISFAPIDFTERMAVIARQRCFYGLEPNPVAMLQLASVPMIRASRPRDMERIADFGSALIDYFS